MKIGIDISQLAYPNTGVSTYLESLVLEMVKNKNHSYVLFFSSLRAKPPQSILDILSKGDVELKTFIFPPALLHISWNILHTMPIENLIGSVDLFITSDWTEPPSKKALKATILYDLIVYKYPEETHNQTEFNLKKMILSQNIVKIQKKRLSWVKKESSMIFCISKSTMDDANSILKIPTEKMTVIYPGC